MQNQIIALGNIKHFAQKRNIPLTELADKIGMTYVGLSKIIRENTTTLTTVVKIAEILNIPVQLLFVSKEALENLEGFSLEKYAALKKENEDLKKEMGDLKNTVVRLADKLS